MYPKNPVIPKIIIIVITGNLVAEDEKKFTYGLIFTALPETIVLFGFLAIFLL